MKDNFFTSRVAANELFHAQNPVAMFSSQSRVKSTHLVRILMISQRQSKGLSLPPGNFRKTIHLNNKYLEPVDDRSVCTDYCLSDIFLIISIGWQSNKPFFILLFCNIIWYLQSFDKVQITGNI